MIQNPQNPRTAKDLGTVIRRKARIKRRLTIEKFQVWGTYVEDAEI
jgi:hypothetical protein